MSRRSHRNRAFIARRVAAAFVGVIAGLLVLEGFLAATALVVGPAERSGEGFAEGERRVLCIGDSNTFGIHLDPADSYPAQLGELLERAPGGPWRVVNLGLPGRNSAEARYHLVRQLELYRPEIVIAWVGVNTSWSREMGHLWKSPDAEPPPPLMALVERSRIVRMLRVVGEGKGSTADPDALGEGGRLPFTPENRLPRAAVKGKPPSDAVARERVRMDLARIRALCDAAGAKLLLLDYPYDVATATNANRAIRDVAVSTATPLLSLVEVLQTRLADLGWQRLVFDDWHLKAEGNAELARLVAGELARLGWVEDGEWRRVPSLEERVFHLRFTASVHDGVLAIRLIGTPAARAEVRVEPLVHSPRREYPMQLPDAVRAKMEEYFPTRTIVPIAALPDSGEFQLEIPLPGAPRGIATLMGAGHAFAGWSIVARGQLDGEYHVTRARFVTPSGRVVADPRELATGGESP